jgi:hypothetical protein
MALKHRQSSKQKKHPWVTGQLKIKSGSAHTNSISSAAPIPAKNLTIGSEPNANSRRLLFSHEAGIASSNGVSAAPKTESDIRRMAPMERGNNDDASDFRNRDRRSPRNGRYRADTPIEQK